MLANCKLEGRPTGEPQIVTKHGEEVADWSYVNLNVEVELEHGRHQLAFADAVLTLSDELARVPATGRREVLSLLRAS
jgi:hypothetical protein